MEQRRKVELREGDGIRKPVKIEVPVSRLQ